MPGTARYNERLSNDGALSPSSVCTDAGIITSAQASEKAMCKAAPVVDKLNHVGAAKRGTYGLETCFSTSHLTLSTRWDNNGVCIKSNGNGNDGINTARAGKSRSSSVSTNNSKKSYDDDDNKSISLDETF